MREWQGYQLPSCPHEVLCLYSQRSHLTVLRALLNILDQLFLLIFEFHTFTVKFSLRLFECPLVLAQALGGRHALAKGPFHNLGRRQLVVV